MPAAPTVILLLERVTVAVVALPPTITTPSPGSAAGVSGAGTVVVVVDVVDVELVVGDPDPTVMPFRVWVDISSLVPFVELFTVTAGAVVVVTGSSARPFTVEVTGRKPMRVATTETVEVADGVNPDTVICAPERATLAPFVALVAYE